MNTYLSLNDLECRIYAINTGIIRVLSLAFEPGPVASLLGPGSGARVINYFGMLTNAINEDQNRWL